MKRYLPRTHRLPDWFKRRTKHIKRKIGEQKYRLKITMNYQLKQPL